jgi:hypothetical protein
LNLLDDIRAVYVDGNGQKIGDSNSLFSNKSESFAEFNSFKNGKADKAGNKLVKPEMEQKQLMVQLI